MSKIKTMGKQLQKPKVPNELKDRILSNWQDQLEISDKKFTLFRHPALFAYAAGFLIIVFSTLSISTTPEIVYFAMNDIKNEAKHRHGLSINLAQIQNEFDLNTLPESMHVSMTKKCSLGKQETVHLEMAYSDAFSSASSNDWSNAPPIHVFLSKGEIDLPMWKENIGTINDMPWKLISPRPGLSVLILFDSTIESDTIDKLTREMFTI